MLNKTRIMKKSVALLLTFALVISFLPINVSAKASSTQIFPIILEISVDNAPVRNGFTKNDTVVKTYQKGATLTAVDFKVNSSGNVWFKVSRPVEGWIYWENVKLNEQILIDVAMDNAPVRKGYTQNHDKVETYSKSTILSVVDFTVNNSNNLWFKVAEPVNGWIYWENVKKHEHKESLQAPPIDLYVTYDGSQDDYHVNIVSDGDILCLCGHIVVNNQKFSGSKHNYNKDKICVDCGTYNPNGKPSKDKNLKDFICKDVTNGLDYVGLVFDTADVVNVFIYIACGDYKSAALSGVSVLSIAGNLAKIDNAKVFYNVAKRTDNVVDTGKKVIKITDNKIIIKALNGGQVSRKDLLSALIKDGFKEVRQTGSHIILKGINGETVVVPYHNKDFAIGTLNNILKQAGYK